MAAYDYYKILKDIPNLKLYRKSTLLILELLGFGLLLWLFSGSNVQDISLREWIIVFFILIIIFSVWYFNARIPRNKKGDIGFIVAFSAETKEHYEKIAQDFIYTLRDLLSKGTLAHSLNFIILPEHHALKIQNTEVARR